MWTLEPRSRLRTLALLVDSSRQEHGGACISKLYEVSAIELLGV